jgi:mycothiol synthase
VTTGSARPVAGVVRTFRAEDEPDVRGIMEACLATDAIPGFVTADIERALVRVRAVPSGTVVAVEGDRVVGYCTPNHDDLTVHPDARRRGHGRRLVEAARRLVRDRDGVDEVLQLYVPAHLPGSIAFAEAVGLRYRSSLWQFELAADGQVPPPRFPATVVTRTWDESSTTDMDAWCAFMHAAFEGHPTPMHWTPEIIQAVHDAPGFDPSGVLEVLDATDPARRVAFARVEVRDAQLPPGERIGEVGLIGVLPAWRGQGLGRELLRWCVTTLRARGAGVLELSVEADNERATALYRSHGFVPAIEWPHWVIPVR